MDENQLTTDVSVDLNKFNSRLADLFESPSSAVTIEWAVVDASRFCADLGAADPVCTIVRVPSAHDCTANGVVYPVLVSGLPGMASSSRMQLTRVQTLGTLESEDEAQLCHQIEETDQPVNQTVWHHCL